MDGAERVLVNNWHWSNCKVDGSSGLIGEGKLTFEEDVMLLSCGFFDTRSSKQRRYYAGKDD